jgi:hypothetical protein
MELRTTKRTPLVRAASIALRFNATSSGVGPHRRKTCSTPCIAASSEAGSPRSPVTEAALLVANDDEPPAVLDELAATFNLLLDGLLETP